MTKAAISPLGGPFAQLLSTAGAPTTGTWSTGQSVIDSSGVVWNCTAGGTPGTWSQQTPVAEIGYLVNTTAQGSLSSTNFAALTGMSKTVTIPNNGRPVYVKATLVIEATATLAATFDITEDGTSTMGGIGVSQSFNNASQFAIVSLPEIRRTPSAGSHTYAVVYKVSTSSIALSPFSEPSTISIENR